MEHTEVEHRTRKTRAGIEALFKAIQMMATVAVLRALSRDHAIGQVLTIMLALLVTLWVTAPSLYRGRVVMNLYKKQGGAVHFITTFAFFGICTSIFATVLFGVDWMTKLLATSVPLH